MNELVHASLQFPTVVFTIALGIVLLYWLFVVLGALDIDLLGGGHHDFDLGDAAVGGAKAGAEALHHGGDAGGDADADADADGGGIWSGLGLGVVPVTISVSVIVLVAWCASMLVMYYALGDVGDALRAVLVIGFLLGALPIAALLVRPLAPVFRIREGKSAAEYVGHLCTINTGRVDNEFGDATVEDGGTKLIVQVRCDATGKLARGDKALIIEFDPARQAYVVEPSADMLAFPVKDSSESA